jgi:hypothetical protein
VDAGHGLGVENELNVGSDVGHELLMKRVGHIDGQLAFEHNMNGLV